MRTQAVFLAVLGIIAAECISCSMGRGGGGRGGGGRGGGGRGGGGKAFGSLFRSRSSQGKSTKSGRVGVGSGAGMWYTSTGKPSLQLIFLLVMIIGFCAGALFIILKFFLNHFCNADDSLLGEDKSSITDDAEDAYDATMLSMGHRGHHEPLLFYSVDHVGMRGGYHYTYLGKHSQHTASENILHDYIHVCEKEPSAPPQHDPGENMHAGMDFYELQDPSQHHAQVYHRESSYPQIEGLINLPRTHITQPCNPHSAHVFPERTISCPNAMFLRQASLQEGGGVLRQLASVPEVESGGGMHHQEVPPPSYIESVKRTRSHSL